MSVYVDSMMGCVRNRKWRWTEVCHLFADSDEELLAFGGRIGLKATWLQRSKRKLTHFDLIESVRRKAVRAGAIEVDREFVVER